MGYFPYLYCEKTYRANCFICSGVYCKGLAEVIAEKLFWETYSYEN